MLKSDARSLFLEKRRELSVSEIAVFNLNIFQLFTDYLPEDIETVHTYLPIRHKIEVDTWSIIHWLWENEKQVVAPVMNSETQKISSLELNEDTLIKENNWKVPEPQNGRRIDAKRIDAVIVPLLAVDKQGNRAGYGKGYYDHFLSKCKNGTLKIGLCFEPPVEKIPDLEDHDIPLDYCITPDKVYRFTPSSSISNNEPK